MNLFTPAELTGNYAGIGVQKTEKSFAKLLVLSVLAGLIIAFGSAATSTAAHAFDNVSAVRLICGLLFPFGLGMVMLTGAELFTGNCLIVISVLEKRTTIAKMLRNWLVVYCGNLLGALLLAVGCARFGQLDISGGGLAVFTIRMAASKCAASFGNALVQGIFCNVLVCLGVICALSAKDAVGRILGAYLPVSLFVFCAFEHCVANMYYIPAGLSAMGVPRYAEMAVQAGIDTAALSLRGFLLGNLLPVTIGNIIGGVLVGGAMWFGHLKTEKVHVNA